MVTEQLITETYGEVMLRTQELTDAIESLTSAKQTLEKCVSEGMRDGRIQGKNESERKAASMDVFGPEFEEVDKAEKVVRLSEYALKISRLRLDCVRDLIRIEELAKR